MALTLVVRHGQTSWNVAGRIIGQADPPLNELGVQQATTLGRYLRTVDPGELWSSDLLRARQTAERVGAECGLPVRATAALREANFGSLQGSFIHHLATSEEWSRRGINKYSYKPPGGESYLEMESRVGGFLSILPRNKVSVVVTHSGVIRVIYRLLNGVPPVEAGRLEPGHLDIWAVDLQLAERLRHHGTMRPFESTGPPAALE